VQIVKELFTDCDQDVLLIKVEQTGAANARATMATSRAFTAGSAISPIPLSNSNTPLSASSTPQPYTRRSEEPVGPCPSG